MIKRPRPPPVIGKLPLPLPHLPTDLPTTASLTSQPRSTPSTTGRPALYVTTDDLLKRAPHLAPWRPAVGIATKLSDAELVTLAVMQALLGFTSQARWLRYARAHLGHLFHSLPSSPATTSDCVPPAGCCNTSSACWPATPRCGPTTCG